MQVIIRDVDQKIFRRVVDAQRKVEGSGGGDGYLLAVEWSYQKGKATPGQLLAGQAPPADVLIGVSSFLPISTKEEAEAILDTVVEACDKAAGRELVYSFDFVPVELPPTWAWVVEPVRSKVERGSASHV
jgi:hypothetical protein